MTPRILTTAAVLVLAAGCSGTPTAPPSVAASSPAASAADPGKLMECTVITRGYQAWTAGTNRMASLRQVKGDPVAAEYIVGQAKDATDDFTKAVRDWPAEGAKLLHTAVLDFAWALGLLNLEVTLGGKGQFTEAALKEVEGKAVGVVLAYDAYVVGCPK